MKKHCAAAAIAAAAGLFGAGCLVGSAIAETQAGIDYAGG